MTGKIVMSDIDEKIRDFISSRQNLDVSSIQRIDKYKKLLASGIPAFPNDFRISHRIGEVVSLVGSRGAEELEEMSMDVSVAGRIVSRRDHGRTNFFHIKDGSGRIQIYARRDDLGEGAYDFFRSMVDVGDFVGVQGEVFRTRTGELTVKAGLIKLLAKAFRPLPEKFHGLTDVEVRYRQRYLDLIANEHVVNIFRTRMKIIKSIRRFLDDRGFLEVETPMMQPIPGGAMARPFVTHHNALDMDLYLRIAPELYLKRLVVGGLDRVYELNRNFRNEGISTQHNPEFTMLEFYQAYATYRDLMELTEEMIESVAVEVLGTTRITYQGMEVNLSRPWKRVRLFDLMTEHTGLNEAQLKDMTVLVKRARELDIDLDPLWGPGKILMEIFEKTVEEKLVQPTFVIDYPVEVSPLSRRRDDDPDIVERFELYIAGREIANAFSELNDPIDQRERFLKQAEAKTELGEAGKLIDEDYIRALEHGMPPTAGEGIGIDRLVMVLTDSYSIREVILFPQLRAEDGSPVTRK